MPDTSSITTPLVLERAPNFRDLGGHRTTDGRQVRHGLVFRSGQLVGLTDTDLEQLTSLGLRTVVDFRGEFELELFGEDRLPLGVRWVSLPIAAAGMDPSTHAALRQGDFTALPDLSLASRRFIRHNTDALGRLLDLASHRENLPLVFHCIGGKDRTGVAAAVVLALLGVPWPAIRADYMETNNRQRITVAERVAWLAHHPEAPEPIDQAVLDAAHRFFVVRPEYIDAARDEVMRLAGSFERYAIDDLGLDAAVIENLRRNLLIAQPVRRHP